MSSLIKKKHFRYFLLFSSPIFTGIVIVFNPDRAMGDILKRGEISLELAQAPNTSTTNRAICNSDKKTIEGLLNNTPDSF
ncbi:MULTISPECIES: hypothetical protein [unclassified Microcoleus]|uniref:hypothetical protein n=1 Tax=unclassified Microcoleus TaxID=2642155 RepID=UPI002FD0858E